MSTFLFEWKKNLLTFLIFQFEIFKIWYENSRFFFKLNPSLSESFKTLFLICRSTATSKYTFKILHPAWYVLKSAWQVFGNGVFAHLSLLSLGCGGGLALFSDKSSWWLRNIVVEVNICISPGSCQSWDTWVGGRKSSGHVAHHDRSCQSRHFDHLQGTQYSSWSRVEADQRWKHENLDNNALCFRRHLWLDQCCW